MTSFLYLVSYRAHCGAIVAVVISGPKHAQDRGRHKTVMHRKATIWQDHGVHCSKVSKKGCGGCKDCYHGCPALHCETGPLAPRGSSPLAEGHQVLLCPL